jgi:predicted alpha/beta superfamily hydrolase
MVQLASQPPGPSVPNDPVPTSDSLTIASRVLGERRRINVHLPAGYAASRGRRYPVLYMPDGGLDEDFPHVVNTVDSLIALGAIRPVIVVGIPNTQRRRDLTGPTRVASDSAIAPRVGGSAAFRAFIRDELFPTIAARYRVTDERAIVGESLAGLFIVETLLEAPAMFDHYVAFDPSLWWDRGALVDAAPARLARLDARPRRQRVPRLGARVAPVELHVPPGPPALQHLRRARSNRAGERPTLIPRHPAVLPVPAVSQYPLFSRYPLVSRFPPSCRHPISSSCISPDASSTLTIRCALVSAT